MHLSQLDGVVGPCIDLSEIPWIDLHPTDEMRCDEEDDLPMLQFLTLRAE